jgi:6-phosphofructokinase
MLRCLIATLGKDAPGINAVVRAVTRLAIRRGMEVYGAKRGFVGVLDGSYRRLQESDVGFIIGRGGSVLGSTDFRLDKSDADGVRKIGQALRQFDLIVAVGGLGSFALLNRVYDTCRMGFTTTMFVPASIEGEFLNPAHKVGADSGEVHAEAVGADTAANTAVAAIDRLREQSYLSRTVFLVECVGAKANFLPIQVGAATGAHRVYLPRYPLLNDEAKAEVRSLFGESFDPNYVDVKELVGWIERMFEESQKTYLLAIIPNGVPLVNTLSVRGTEPPREEYESIITSMAPLELTVLRVVDQLQLHFAGTGSVLVRYVLLDDLQRGGAPSFRDRVLGTLYGEAAVEEFLALVNWEDTEKRGNLNLLAISDTSSVSWRSHPRQAVTPIFQGPNPRAGGLDPLPFFRQFRGTVSGYRPMAML